MKLSPLFCDGAFLEKLVRGDVEDEVKVETEVKT